ncbi:MAG: low molecular weight phosphatase family protein [Opitutae bacterium]|nr:low molecular weight phosphatase family protein [Opitutae bacterium]|tara:strand:- start:6763 stop:7185 length:423 start_codon:yes stop_codon:yes gene_type:complete
MRKVLFVCIHNSARSQMAEAFLNQMGEGRFSAESAGLEPGELNPVVVEAMQEVGWDLSGNSCDSIDDFLPRAEEFAYVVTVCDETAAERCPTFPGVVKRLHWGFPDPSSFEGSFEERLERTRKVRDLIKGRIAQWLSSVA